MMDDSKKRFQIGFIGSLGFHLFVFLVLAFAGLFAANHVDDKIVEIAVFGGEQSGHIIFSRYAATGDGILTSLMVMEACVEKKATLCDLAREMKVYPQLLRNVRVADKKIARENPKVVAAVEEVAKKLGSDGRILVRESGTEPLIRVMVEAETDEMCRENVDKIVKVLHEKGHVPD